MRCACTSSMSAATTPSSRTASAARSNIGYSRLLPHRRHRALQPARTRHRQALRSRKPPARHRWRLPEGPGMAHGEADQGQVQDPAGHQGHRHRRGREIAVDHGVEWIYVSNHGGRQLDHGRGAMHVLPEIVDAVKRPRQDHGRRLVLPRHRHRQGDRHGRRSRRHRPPAMLGAGGRRRSRRACGCWNCSRTK